MRKLIILILSLAWAQSSFAKYHCYSGKRYLSLELINTLPGKVEVSVRKRSPYPTAYMDYFFWAGILNGHILTDYDGSKVIVASGNLSSYEGETDHYSSIVMNLSNLALEETISGSGFKTYKVQWKCKFAQ